MIPSFSTVDFLFIINIKESYENQQVLVYKQVPDAASGIKWVKLISKTGEAEIIDSSKIDGEFFPDVYDSRNQLEEKFNILARKMLKARAQLTNFLYEEKKVTPLTLIKKIASVTRISLSEADALLKLEIAKRGRFEYIEDNKKGFIKLSVKAKIKEDKKRFLSGITNELKSNSDRIELLISHNLTKGNYREHLLRNLLKKYIPRKFEVATGFIEGCNRQCDIIIYDAHNYSPFFKENELVVVPLKSVRAVIEVKTTIDPNALELGLELLNSIDKASDYVVPFFKGIFGFRTTYASVSTIIKTIQTFYINEELNYGIGLYQPIDSLAILDSYFIQSDLCDYSGKDQTIIPRLYSFSSSNKKINIAGSSFFTSLFNYLDVEKHAKNDNSDYFRDLEFLLNWKFEGLLVSKGWEPRAKHYDYIEQEGDIEKRFDKVLEWQIGDLSISEVEKPNLPSYNFDNSTFFGNTKGGN